MRTRLKLNPGERGTKKLQAKYGDRLVCVRYRYDEQQQKRYKTVELIEEEVDWEPKRDEVAARTLVEIQVDWMEGELREQVKAAGGRWNPERKVWRMEYGKVKDLGLEKRIVERKSP
jgi:hypothetical protein